MKVLLVHPYSKIPWIDKTHLIEPLALEYLAAGLEPLGHEIRIVDQRLEPDYTKDDFRAMADYVRHDLKLPYASFTMMTPFPGTRIHEENRERITSHDTELFDFCHMVLPTRLSLKEFYAEFSDLYLNALPPGTVDSSNEFLRSCRDSYKLHELPEGAPQ
jgi:hypothetical protein